MTWPDGFRHEVGPGPEPVSVDERYRWDLEEAMGVLPADIIRLCYRDDEIEGVGDMSSIRAKAERTLPADILGPLVADGMSAAKIGQKHGLPMWVVYELKKKYWPDGFGLSDYAEHRKDLEIDLEPQKEDEGMSEEQERYKVQPEPGSGGGKQVSIHTLIERRQLAADDLDSIKLVINDVVTPLSLGVKEVLQRHRERCQEELVWINGVFEKTMIEVPGVTVDGNNNQG